MEVAQPGVEFLASAVGECCGRVLWASAVGHGLQLPRAEGFRFFGARIGF
jgi:hypothetical protein